ncbi:MAG: cyclic nucleotide-binding/CBS domain-containing protein [Candidatus Hydrothermarchaeota archaeon]
MGIIGEKYTKVSLVKDIMIEEVLFTDVSSSIIEVANLMSTKDVGSLIVTKNEKPVGIITERDILKKVVAKGLDPKETKVSEVMHTPLITIDSESSVFQAAELMNMNKIRRLPAVKDDKIVGIVTVFDIITHYREVAGWIVEALTPLLTP